MLNYGPAVLIIFSVFVGILLNRRDVTSLKEDLKDEMGRRFNEVNRQFSEVNQKFDEVNRRLTLIETDQKQFFTITGRMDGRIDEIARR